MSLIRTQWSNLNWRSCSDSQPPFHPDIGVQMSWSKNQAAARPRSRASSLESAASFFDTLPK